MIEGSRGKKFEYLALKALESRIPSNHPVKEKVLKDFKIKHAEVKGENEVKYQLRFLDNKNFIVLYNLRLKDGNGYFQMDFLVMTKSFILNVDSKNWQGTCIFGANGQVTRKLPDGSKKGILNPIDQVKMQVRRLRRWMNNHHFPDIPIKFLSVSSFPTNIIERETAQDHIPDEVIHSSDLIFRIDKLEQMYKKDILTEHQLQKLSYLLQKSHCPADQNLFEKYELSRKDILKGVFCPKCNALPMIRHQRKWYCKNCKHVSTDAHRLALNDYILLFGEWITNKQARDFLLISSAQVTKYMLGKECVSTVGSTKGKKYKLRLKL